jgi:hypothetical protein
LTIAKGDFKKACLFSINNNKSNKNLNDFTRNNNKHNKNLKDFTIKTIKTIYFLMDLQ